MTSRLPKAVPRDGRSRVAVWVLMGIVAALAATIGFLLTGVMEDQPSSDLQRDYELLLQGAERNPENAALLMTLAETEYELGKESEALEHARKAVKADEADLAIQVRFAQLLVKAGKPDDARRILESVIDKDGKGSAESHFMLAQVLAGQGRSADAIEHMEKGLDLQPIAADMRVVFARILEQAGEKERAIEMYKQALGYLPGNEEATAALRRLGVEESEIPTVAAHGATGTGE